MSVEERPSSGRRRTPNACSRCRRHKIKCSGNQPCTSCTRRGQSCVFPDRERFSQDYVHELQRRVAAAEQARGNPEALLSPQAYEEGHSDLHPQTSSGQPAVNDQEADPTSQASEHGTEQPVHMERTSSTNAQGPINHFATGKPFYVPDARGRVVYLGTSSTWSYGRRVLLLAHERIMKAPLSPNQLLWEGQAYNLGWNGERSIDTKFVFGDVVVPQADYAIYLVNAVKFYVGQLFHLFDESAFMDNFTKFYDPAFESPTTSSLWYNHYLLVLAFGKAFVSREGTNDHRPAGCAFFLQAMATLPDLAFADPSSFDVLEAIEVLCCSALYLHSLDFRSAAYRQIGQALRIALEHGLHTDMEHHHNPEQTLERPRRIWWTVLLLDRQMSSLMGVPLALRDEDISAKLPSYGSSVSRVRALDIHVRLSSVLATIVTNLYGKEGRLNSKFLVHTRAALKDVASLTDELNDSFNLPLEGPVSGISRVSAYLHLMLHQCIVLATRPILFSHFEARLSRKEEVARGTRPSTNIWALLQMCRDSAVHMLRILQVLKGQGLLESFLPFDLDATYTSAMVAQLAAHIDAPLLEDERPLNKMAYECLDEMASRGNQIARTLEAELKQLETILARLPHNDRQAARTYFGGTLPSNAIPNDPLFGMAAHAETQTSGGTVPSSAQGTNGSIDWFGDNSTFQDLFTAPHMTSVADSINLDGMEWWFNSNPDLDLGQDIEL